MSTIQETLNDMKEHQNFLVQEQNKCPDGYVYVRPENLGLIVLQLPEGVEVGPAIGETLPTVFSKNMALVNLSTVKSIAEEPKIEVLHIMDYLKQSIDSYECTINSIKRLLEK